MRRFAIIFAILFATWSLLDGASTKSDSYWQDFLSREGKNWRASFHDSGRLKTLYASTSVNNTHAKTPEELVSDYHQLFGAEHRQDLRFSRKESEDWFSEYVYRQYSSGIPVEGAELHLLLDRKSKLIAATSTLERNVQFKSGNVYPADVAIARANRLFGGRAESGRPSLVLLPSGKFAKLAWRIPVDPIAMDEGSRLIFVDATNPNIILRMVKTYADAEGRGTVFPENPVVTPETTIETFKNMDTSTSLSGKFVKIYDANFEQFSPAFIPDLSLYTTASDQGRQYNYETTDARFTEAMGYFHINRVHDQWKSFGFNKLNKRMPVFVNVMSRLSGDGFDNAFYRRNIRFPTGMIIMGAGDFFENFGHDADVYYHEYGHAVLDHVKPEFFEAIENNYSGAFHEGFSDVSSSAITGNSKLAEFALSRKSNHKFLGRELENNNRFPQNVIYPPLRQSESHHTGLIFGGAWWDLQKRIGLEKAQRILYQSLRMLPQDMTFFSIRDSMLTVDQSQNGGANSTAINDAFGEHGITGPDPGQPGNVNVTALKTAKINVTNGNLTMKSTFKKGDIIDVLANYTGTGLTPGYNLIVVQFQMTGPQGGVIDSIAWFGEVLNGTNTGKRGSLQAEIYTTSDTKSGTYSVTIQSRLGGTSKLTEVRSVSFKVVD
ncbi:MAG TPA: M36 family metallopeptidase [Acidobacteriota bacterium]|nr:M36 family metallopeptidase [Acidobacteriota bacterium]